MSDSISKIEIITRKSKFDEKKNKAPNTNIEAKK